RGAIRRLAEQLAERVRRRGVKALVGAGDRERDAGNWVLAALHYRDALARAPDLAPIWVQLGHALKEQGDYAAAEAAYRRALALDGSVADTHLQLGHLLKLRGHRVQAVDAYATAGRLDPRLDAAREASHALASSWRSETERAILLNSGWEAATTPAPSRLNSGAALADRYGPLTVEATRKAGTGHAVILLGGTA